MLSESEKAFLNIINNLRSPNNEIRAQTEEQLKTIMEQNYTDAFTACFKIATSEDIEIFSRQYSMFLITEFLKPKTIESFTKFDENFKQNLKNSSLQLLGHNSPEIRNSACSLVASLASVLYRVGEWQELIGILCNAMKNPNAEFKLSSISTLGQIWDRIPPGAFTTQELNQMEQALMNLLQDPPSEQIAIIALNSFKSFLPFINPEQGKIENYLGILRTRFNPSQINTQKTFIAAIHSIFEVVRFYYQYVGKYFHIIAEDICKTCVIGDESVGIQGFLFWCCLADEEVERTNRGKSIEDFCIRSWKPIWECILDAIAKRDVKFEKENPDEFTRYKCIFPLINYFSKLHVDYIFEDINKFMTNNLNANTNMISSISVFASTLDEEAHSSKISVALSGVLAGISKYLAGEDMELRHTTAWCIRRICKCYSDFFMNNNNNNMENILNLFVWALNNTSKEAKVEICLAIYELMGKIKSVTQLQLNIIELLTILNNLAYDKNNYSKGKSNLCRFAFYAISSLLECCTSLDQNLLTNYLNNFVVQLDNCLKLENFGGNKEMLYEFQAYNCQIVTAFANNSRLKSIYPKNLAEILFSKVTAMFDMRQCVFEDGMIAISNLTNIEPKLFATNLLAKYMSYVNYSLEQYKDIQNCHTALITMSTVIFNVGPDFIGQIPELMKRINVIKSSDSVVDRELKSAVLIAYSDLFRFAPDAMISFLREILEYIDNAIDACLSYLEDVDDYPSIKDENFLYFNKLKINVSDFLESILSKFVNKRDEKEFDLLKNSMPKIMDFLSKFLMCRFIPSNDEFVIHCLGIYLSSLSIFNGIAIDFIPNEAVKVISDVIDKTGDKELGNLRDSLNGKIYSLKIGSLNLF